MLVFEGLHINSAKLIKKLRTAKKIWNLISKLIAQTRLIHLGYPFGGMITLSGRVAEDVEELGSIASYSTRSRERMRRHRYAGR